jgi:hypothetical protein
MDTGREVVVWQDPLALEAERLARLFPYGHEALSLTNLIKMVLWVQQKEKQ